MSLDNLLHALDEDILLKAANVEITTRVARFGNLTFQVANIGSTELTVKRKLNAFATAMFIAVLCLGGYAIHLNSIYSDQMPLVSGAAIVMAIGAIVVQQIWPKLISTLIVKTSSNDVHRIESSN